MKKVPVLLLVTVILISFTSCKKSEESQQDLSSASVTDTISETAPSNAESLNITNNKTSSTATEDTNSEELGPLVNDPEILYGSWAFVEKVDKIGDFSRKTSYALNDPETDIYSFDQIYVKISHKGGVYFTAKYEVKNGVFTMEEKAANARPITYTQLRLKDNILTAQFKDRDILTKMKWQKLQNNK